MTKKKPPAPPADDDLVSQEAFDMMTFLEEVGPSISRVYIYRILKNGDFDYVARTTVDLLRDGCEDYIRDTYGHGKFQLRFKGSDGQWKLQKTLSIGPEGKVSDLAPAGPAAAALDSMTFLREQANQNQQLILKLIEGLSGNRGPDPAQMMTSIVTAFVALKTAATEPKAAENGDWIEKTKNIIELAQQLAPGGSTQVEENVWTVVKEVGKEIADRIIPAAQAPPAPGGGPPLRVTHLAPNPPASIEAGPPAPTAPPAPTTVQDWIAIQIGFLKTKAAKDSPPDLYIDYILENSDDEPGCNAIMQAIEQGATFERLLQFDPEIGQNPKFSAWFRKLYDGLLRGFNEALDSARPGGHVDNPPNNGGAIEGEPGQS